VRTKLFLTFGLVLLVAVGASAYSAFTIRHLRNMIREEIVPSASRLDDTRQITIALAYQRIAMRGISIFASLHNTEQTQNSRDLFKKSGADVHDVLERLRLSANDAQDQTLINAIRTGLDQWSEYFGKFADLTISGQVQEANTYATKNITPIMDVLQKSLSELGKVNRARQDAAVLAAESGAQLGQWLILLLTIVVGLSGAGAFWVLAQLTKTLNGIAESLAESAQQVNRSSEHMAQSSQTLAESMTEQAASVEETSASTQEVATMTKQARTDSGAAAETTATTMRKVEETTRLMEGTVASMESISGSSKKISQIISVIEGIAFQTNILALNAAVEAARAGEAGMGFAVVADEVRNLAHRSADAASDTSRLISESIENASQGSKNFSLLSDAIRAISTSTLQVDKLVSGVSAASREQSTGIDQIATAMQQIEQVTQRSAAAAEEGSATSLELKEQAEELKSLARKLSVLTGSRTDGVVAA